MLCSTPPSDFMYMYFTIGHIVCHLHSKVCYISHFSYIHTCFLECYIYKFGLKVVVLFMVNLYGNIGVIVLENSVHNGTNVLEEYNTHAWLPGPLMGQYHIRHQIIL